jgi:LmbE family N-acetylglucosaminyl deacetylase
VPVEEALTRGAVLLVAAHPDDETVSVGGILTRLQDLVIAHVTDGAPRNRAAWQAAGYDTREDYARARRQESLNALELAGIPEERIRRLDFVDQEASLDMPRLTNCISTLVRELRPAVILTHPYEGGHPDHDATAFAVHAACLLANHPPHVYEFTSYHALNREGAAPGLEFGRFLPGEEAGKAITLTNPERERKARMVECYSSQLAIVRQFPIDVERFRGAPVYNFTNAPHPGRLFYENFDWGTTGEQWRLLAALALRTLGIPETL